MVADNLFRKADGSWVTAQDLRSALTSIGAHDCRVLYMHSGLSFGIPNPELSRNQLLEAIYTSVRALGVPTLCVPTYTFSFCNGETYDRAQSRSRMGALNEFIRRHPDSLRSVDPLLSVAVVGTDRDLAENLGHKSIGTNSTFDKLSRREDVKFLFLGVRLGECFTYMHYLEWQARVPYRYNRPFSGRIIDGVNSFEDVYTLFVRYKNVKPNAACFTYEQLLAERGLLKIAPLGDHSVGCVGEKPARELYLSLLKKEPNYFIEQPFVAAEADATFSGGQMVSL